MLIVEVTHPKMVREVGTEFVSVCWGGSVGPMADFVLLWTGPAPTQAFPTKFFSC